MLTMAIIDTHAHLDHIEDLDAALNNARQEGVGGIVTMSVNAQSCLKNLDIKRRSQAPKIFLAFGMHPSDANLDQLKTCVQLIREHQGELTAIGEISLEF